MEIKERIIELFNNNISSLTIEEIMDKLNEKDIEEDIYQLVEDNIIIKNNKNKYNFINRLGYYIGYIDIKLQGYGFVKVDNIEDDFYINERHINHALDKDKVLIKQKEQNQYLPSLRKEAEVIKVIERNLKFLVGTLALNKNGILKFKKDDTSFNLYVEVTDYNNATVDDIVKLEITEFKTSTYVIGKVVKILGNKYDVGMDISKLACSYGFETDFCDEALNEIKEYKEEFLNPRRKDLKNKKIITIDGEDARDLDDAVALEILSNGNYLLGVYIADVSFYVKEGSLLDQEAYNRGTSCYLTDRVIPMLPRRISNDLCSLNENTDKLVIGVEVEINEDGEIINQNIFEGVIKTLHRMTYNNVNKILDNEIDACNKYLDIKEELFNMEKLANILRNVKEKRGSLDFDIPEGKVIVDDKGHPIDVVLRTRGKGEKIIEDFMILANEVIASTCFYLDLPFIYRIHPEPESRKMDEFSKIASILGYKFRLQKGNIYANQLQYLLTSIKEEDSFLKTLILRTMSKARYSEENVGHFGLASKCYTHFTSPIRRYPDLIVHRLIRKYILNGDINHEEFTMLYQKIEDIANQSSKRERDAINLEYDVEDMKKAEYMEDHLNEEFEGSISSITNFGIFITLPNTIEGLIHISDLIDDYYEYYPEYKMLVGRRTHNKYQIGNKVKVIVTSTNKKTREINFKIVYNKDSRNKEKKIDFKKEKRYGKDKGHRSK